MMSGVPPFFSKNQKTMLNQIVKSSFEFPEKVKFSDAAKDLITKVSLKKNKVFQAFR